MTANRKISKIGIRQSLIADIAEHHRRQGKFPDIRAIEKSVDAMIQNHEGKNQYRRPAVKRKRERKPFEETRAFKTAESLGRVLVKRPVQDIPLPQRRKKHVCNGCKSCKLEARMRVLYSMKMVIGSDGKKTPQFDFPEFASEALRETMREANNLGDYAGKTKAERSRILFVRLEQICDKSAATLGEWR